MRAGAKSTTTAAVVALALLAGCSDPLDQIPRLSSVELPDENTAEVSALPAASEEQTFWQRLRSGGGAANAPETEPDTAQTPEPTAAPAPETVTDRADDAVDGGIEPDQTPQPAKRGLAALFGRKAPAADEPQPETGAEPVSEATSDPLTQDQPEAQAEAAPDKPAKRGLAALFARKSPTSEPEQEPQSAAVEAPAPETTATKTPEASTEPEKTAQANATADAPEADQSAKTPDAKAPSAKGLFGFLKAGSKSDSAADAPPQDEVKLASLDPAQPAKPATPLLRNPRKSAPSGPDAAEVPFGTVLPYGKVVRVCGVSTSSLGKQIDGYPKNRAKYKLYDSLPGTIAPHSFYITGFEDGCARLVTAALVVFGDVEMHEQLRYSTQSKLPYSTTDKAYDKLKSSVCGVGKGKPCGANLGTIQKGTVFVSLYERFEDNPKWANMLLHDGWVLAMDLKSR